MGKGVLFSATQTTTPLETYFGYTITKVIRSPEKTLQFIAEMNRAWRSS